MPERQEDKRGGRADQLMPRSAYTSILFDLDNTLCYYPLSTAQVISEVLRRADLPEEVVGSVSWAAGQYDASWAEAERSSPSLSETRRRLWRRILAEVGRADDETADRMAGLHHVVRRESGVYLFPGTEELLADLSRRYRLGLLTNGSSEMQWEKIRLLGIEGPFEAIVVAGDVGIYKPDAEVFRLLLDRLAARPEDALFVGDSYDMDIVGAHGAGLDTAWIRAEDAPVEGGIRPEYLLAAASGLREVLL
jgi:2-haloalkanoic acid dehalogenase type II